MATAMKQAMQVLTSQGTTEWYTPPEIIERARRAMGGIDLDPASNETAQQWIKATHYYTADSFPHGLAAPWAGRVWLNPPFDDTPAWVNRLRYEAQEGRVTAACLLVNSAPGYNWFESLWRHVPVLMLRDRLCFVREDGMQGGKAKKGQCIAFFGAVAYTREFGDLGRIFLP